jgi:uncharacterized protein DUF6431
MDSMDPGLVCPCCLGPLDAHGCYFRKSAGLWILRLLCRPCGRTVSLLPTSLLPYRRQTAAQLQQELDDWTETAEDAESTASTTISAFEHQAPKLKEVLGQVVPVVANARELWRAARLSLGSITSILAALAQWGRTSLLGCYRCLSPAFQISPRDRRMPLCRSAVPHNFSAAFRGTDRSLPDSDLVT